MIKITDFLLKIFIKNEDFENNRGKYGNFASVTGIICNIFLCMIKGIAGIVFNSVAILADAVNNLSDAGTSLISLIGFLFFNRNHKIPAVFMLFSHIFSFLYK